MFVLGQRIVSCSQASRQVEDNRGFLDFKASKEDPLVTNFKKALLGPRFFRHVRAS